MHNMCMRDINSSAVMVGCLYLNCQGLFSAPVQSRLHLFALCCVPADSMLNYDSIIFPASVVALVCLVLPYLSFTPLFLHVFLLQVFL